MFSINEILKLRHDERFFVEKFTLMTLTMKKENEDFSPEECVYATALMLSYAIHDTKELTIPEMRESVENLINRFTNYTY